MKETQRIGKLLEAIYNGHPWIDVNLVSVLKGIPAERAAKRISPKWNSIWEITNHIIQWRLNVLERVQGKVINTPGHNYFEAIEDTSESAWKNTLKQLENSQKKWVLFLKGFKEKDFEEVYAGNDLTYYEHIHGIIQHDAYHLGQIVMLAKAL